MTKAKQFEDEYLLSQAIRELRGVKPLEDPRVKDLVDEVASEIDRLVEKDREQQQVVTVGVERVREWLDAHQYDDALRLLRKLPRELHNEESMELLRRAEATVAEIAELKSSLVEAVKQNDLLDLAPQFARLLMLKPGSKSIEQLAKQVGNKIARTAQKRLKAFEYERAVELLNRVPEVAIDEPIERLKISAAELRWLHDDLSRAPIVDAPLVRIAARASKKVPGDEKLLSLCRKVSRLFKDGTDDPRFRVPEFIRPPKRPHFGCDVRWLGGSERLSMDPACEATWQSEPGRFFVAVGLALQGVGLAAINTNLHAEKSSLMNKLSLRRREKQRVAWGLDIGETSLKAVRMVLDEGATDARMDQCILIPHSIPLARHGAERRRSELIGETLRAFLEKQTIEKSERICIGQAGNRVLAKMLELPDAPDKKLPSMIQYEAGQRTPIPLDELAWTYHIFPKPESEDEAGRDEMRRVLLLTEKQSMLEGVMHLLNELNLQPHVVQSEAVALYNFAFYEGLGDLLPTEQMGEGGRIALLDVGTSSSNLVCATPSGIWMRNLVVGGEDFGVAAAKHLHLTAERAEQLKQQPAQAKSLSALYAAFEGPLDRLTSELRRSLDAFAQESGSQVSMLLGVGGGFRLHGLMRHLIYGPQRPH